MNKILVGLGLLALIVNADADIRKGFPHSIVFRGTTLYVGMPAEELSNIIIRLRKKVGVEIVPHTEITPHSGSFTVEYSNVTRDSKENNRLSIVVSNGALQEIGENRTFYFASDKIPGYIDIYSDRADLHKEGVISLGAPNYTDIQEPYHYEYIWEKDGTRYEILSDSSKTYVSDTQAIRSYHKKFDTVSQLTDQFLKLVNIERQRAADAKERHIKSSSNLSYDEIVDDIYKSTSDLEFKCVDVGDNAKQLESEVRKQIKENPSSWVYKCLGEIQEKLGDPDGAIYSYSMSIYYEPAQIDSFEKIAAIYSAQHSYDKATKYYELAESRIRSSIKNSDDASLSEYLKRRLANNLLDNVRNRMNKKLVAGPDLSAMKDNLNEVISIVPDHALSYALRSQVLMNYSSIFTFSDEYVKENQNKACADAQTACDLGMCELKEHYSKIKYCN